MNCLQRLTDLSVFVFVVSSMLTMGLSQRLSDVVASLRKPLPVLLALLVNFALSPLLALMLSRLVPLQPAHAVGLLLLGAAAGAPYLPKLAEISGGSPSYSVALMVLLTGGSIMFLPMALPLIVPGLSADYWSIAKPLLLLMLVPLAVGFAVARAGASWMDALLSFTRKVTNLALVLLIVLMIGLNLKTLAGTLGSFAIAAYALYLLAIIGAGYLIGAIDGPRQNVFALAAGSRNIAAAVAVANANFEDPAITVMLIIAFVVSMIALPVLARVMRSRIAELPRSR